MSGPQSQVTAALGDATEGGSGPVAPTPLPDLPGYEMQGELGRGGMGVVYKARHLSLNRLVAVKMMHGGAGASAHDRARFKLEVEAVAGLQHPNIVQIYEVGEDAGTLYCSLEFVDGGTLGRKLAAGVLTPTESAHLVELLARAVHHAHQRGIIHRDIKPSNVLLMGDGTPKIADFGLAKRIEGQGVTQSGTTILGTPGYMAPEQADSKKRKIGIQTDVYALGATLYEMLTRRPPFHAETPLETVMKVLNDEPVPPTHWRSEVPHDLETICLKCLRKDAAARYASAEALADDLRRFQNGEPIQARPPTVLEKTRHWLKRQREPIALAVGALAVIVLIAVLAWPRDHDAEPAPTPAATKEIKPGPLVIDKTLDLPADLALVPQDAFAFVSIALADLLARDGLLRLEKEIEKIYPQLSVELEKFAREFEKETGLAPKSIARATAVVLDPDDGDAPKDEKKKPKPFADNLFAGGASPPLAILTSTAPYDRAKLLGAFKKPLVEKTHRDKKYHVGEDREGGKTSCLYFVTDRIFVQADTEARMKKFLDWQAAGARRGPLGPALLQAKVQPFAIGFHPSAKQRQEWAASAEPWAQPIFEARAAALSMNWILRTAVGDDAIQANVLLVFPDEARAEKGLAAVATFRDESRKKVNEWREQLRKMEAKDESEKAFASLAAVAMKLLGELDYALQTAKIERHDTHVEAGLTVRIDIAKLMEAQNDAMRKVQVAALRSMLKQINTGLNAYHEKHGRFPPAALCDDTGKPLLSWRVAILPYMGFQKLHDQFNLNEPWDSPHNVKLLEKMPGVYMPMRHGTVEKADFVVGQATYYQVLVGSGAAFEGTKGLRRDDFADGPGQTLLLVEAARPVPWTKPEDIVYDPKVVPKLGADPKEGFAVIFADGNVAVLDRNISAADLHALITRNGKEKVDWKKWEAK
jgi:hypothetical protein